MFIRIICTNQLFSDLVMVLIIINTVVLALDSYPIDPVKDALFGKINTALTWLFFSEMVMKLIGLGVTTYARDRYNIFDSIVVVLTVAENIVDLSVPDSNFSYRGAILGFRSVRILRIFKLARNLRSFIIMIEKISVSIKDIANFSVLLFLFLFTFTLLGLELFANKVKFNADGEVDLVNGTSFRPSFDDFFKAFITIFMVLIGDNWPQYMYKHMIAVGDLSAVFFVFLQVFGKYVLLNLFLAILLENFEDIDEEKVAAADESQGAEATSN